MLIPIPHRKDKAMKCITEPVAVLAVNRENQESPSEKNSGEWE
jgi:hypothetical protein